MASITIPCRCQTHPKPDGTVDVTIFINGRPVFVVNIDKDGNTTTREADTKPGPQVETKDFSHG